MIDITPEELTELITKLYPYYKQLDPHPQALDEILHAALKLNWSQGVALISLCKILYNAVCLRKGAPLKSKTRPKRYKSPQTRRNAIASGYHEIVPFHYASESTYNNTLKMFHPILHKIVTTKLLRHSKKRQSVGFFTTLKNLTMFTTSKPNNILQALDMLYLFGVVLIYKPAKHITLDQTQETTEEEKKSDIENEKFLLSVTRFGHFFISYLCKENLP